MKPVLLLMFLLDLTQNRVVTEVAFMTTSTSPNFFEQPEIAYKQYFALTTSHCCSLCLHTFQTYVKTDIS